MSFQRDHSILVASTAAYPEPPASAAWMIESCRRQGIELTLLGRGRSYPNHRMKPRLVAEYLRDHPEYRYVLQVDFRDVIFCASLREIFHKYRAFGVPIVASAERFCWPMGSHAAHCPDTGTTNRYLNSGAIFAEASAWLAAWDQMCAEEQQHRGEPPERGMVGLHIFDDDQAAWSDLYIRGAGDIALDARCEIFQTLSKVDPQVGTANRDLRFEGRRIVNRETGTRPCLIHCTGLVPIQPWARYVLDPPVPWIWPLIDRIRTEPLLALRDPAQVEQVLLHLGLHEPVHDDVPVDLLPYSDKGLAIRRRPTEFAALLAWLANRPPIRSYVEVGVGSGGAFIATVEFLRRAGPVDLAVAIGPGCPPVLRDYVARTPTAQFIPGRRAADGLQGLVGENGHVEFVLIDAQGSENPRADWNAARACSRFVALHGIAVEEPTGVAGLWQQIRATYPRTHEFVDHRLTPEARAGLGVVDLADSDS